MKTIILAILSFLFSAQTERRNTDFEDFMVILEDDSREESDSKEILPELLRKQA